MTLHREPLATAAVGDIARCAALAWAFDPQLHPIPCPPDTERHLAVTLGFVFGLLTLIIATGAAARITRLVTTDKITAPLRNALLPVLAQPRRHRRSIARGEPVPPPTPLRAALLYQLGCPWCIGMWISLATAGAAALTLDAPPWTILPTALAMSYAVGWLAAHEPTPDHDEDGDAP